MTQISEIKAATSLIIDFAKPALGNNAYSGPAAAALLTFGILLGFLFGYLWTRLFLIGAFREADRLGQLEDEVRTATKKVDELKQQSQLDAEALNVIDTQLNPRPNTPPPSYKQLEEAVKSASKSVKVQIFYRARDLRSKTWRDPNSKSTMELTIPVFRALIAADIERQYHASHGQLAYALKDKEPPNDAEAEKEFTTAIDIRDRLKEDGWSFYELFRAICRIRQDPNFMSKPSEDSLKSKICADLKRACSDREAMLIAKSDPVVLGWCRVNAVSLDQ